MTTFNGVATVTTAAASLLSTSDASGLLYLQNTDATNPIYLGLTVGVTAATGTKLDKGLSVTLPIGQGPSTVYAVSTGGSVVVNYWFGDNPS